MAVDAWEALLGLLDRRALTRAEAEAALAARGCGRSAARSAVAKARRLGLIDDRKVAESIVEHAAQAPAGILKLRHDLERRQVPQDVAAKALQAMDDLERCRAALAQYLGRKGRPQDQREKARVIGYLGRRGFTEESVRQALAEIGIDLGWSDA